MLGRGPAASSSAAEPSMGELAAAAQCPCAARRASCCGTLLPLRCLNASVRRVGLLGVVGLVLLHLCSAVDVQGMHVKLKARAGGWLELCWWCRRFMRCRRINEWCSLY